MPPEGWGAWRLPSGGHGGVDGGVGGGKHQLAVGDHPQMLLVGAEVQGGGEQRPVSGSVRAPACTTYALPMCGPLLNSD